MSWKGYLKSNALKTNVRKKGAAWLGSGTSDWKEKGKACPGYLGDGHCSEVHVIVYVHQS